MHFVSFLDSKIWGLKFAYAAGECFSVGVLSRRSPPLSMAEHKDAQRKIRASKIAFKVAPQVQVG